MAVAGSGLFVPTFLGALGNTQLALNLDLNTHKVALFDNDVTPDLSSDVGYGSAPWNANEVTGTGWSSGGHLLDNAELVEDPAGVITFRADNILIAVTALTGIRCLLGYADALASNNGIFLLDLENDYESSGGFLAIEWPDLGIFSINMSPYAYG